MHRIQKVINYLIQYVDKPDFNTMRHIYLVHMHGVSSFAAMIALKRGLDTEIATIAGLLHDIHTLNTLDSKEHAKKGALLAREVLNELNITTADETDIICKAIHNHSKKKKHHEPYDELLKDADVLHHCLYDTALPPSEKDKERFNQLIEEFNVSYPKYIY